MVGLVTDSALAATDVRTVCGCYDTMPKRRLRREAGHTRKTFTQVFETRETVCAEEFQTEYVGDVCEAIRSNSGLCRVCDAGGMIKL